MAQGIDIGGIYADLDIRTGNLDKGLAKGRAALDAIDKEVRQLTSDFSAGAIGATEYGARMAALSTTTAELTSRMNAAFTATTTLSTGLELVTKNGNDMVHSTNRMGQGLMQLGYIADDLQYGFSGVVNNIAPLVYGLGGSGGLATGVQLVAVAAYQLYVNWDDLMDVMGLGKVRTEAEEMEELANATRRTADEQERLNKYKREQKQIEEIKNLESKEDKETRSVVNEIIGEAGQGVLAGAVADKMMAEVTPEQQERIDELKKKLDDAKKQSEAGPSMGGLGGVIGRGMALGEEKSPDAAVANYSERLDKEIAAVNEERKQEALENAYKLLQKAGKAGAEGEQARKSIQSKLGKLDKNNPLAGVIDQLDPKNIQAQVDKDKAEKARKAAEKAQKEADADRKKEIGPARFLEEQATKGKLTKGEGAELARLLQSETDELTREDERKQKELDADRKKELGPAAFLEEQATKRKLTPGEGAELARLLQADVDKQNTEEQQADDKKAREAKQLERENLRAGMDAAPGDIKAMASTLVMQESAGMIAPGAAFGRIQKAIEDNGATTDEAIAATKEIQSDATKDMEKGITDRLMNPTAQEQRKQSQVFDATSLAAQFQSSVGGDESKKQTTLLEKLEKTVDALAKGGKLVKIK